MTSHEYLKQTGVIYHNSFLVNVFCAVTIGFGCFPFALSAKIDASGQASDLIDPLFDYYNELSDSKSCELEFGE